MAALIAKPGISGASLLLSIPKEWSAKWFGGLVSNLLQGADARNALGKNGIVVSGNITSPYATISIGGAAGGVVFPDTPSGANLTVGTTTAVSFYNQANLPSAPPGGLIFVSGYVSPVRGRLIIGDGTGWHFDFSKRLAGVTTDVFRVTDTGTVSALGATAAALVDMSPDTGTFNGTGVGLVLSIPCRWTKMGNLVALTFATAGAINAVSTTTGFSMTGLPAAITPSVTCQGMMSPWFLDNSAATQGAFGVAANSTVTFYKGTSNAAASWTAALNKGFTATTTIVYSLLG